MLKSILLGLVLTTLTVCIHAIGTTWWIRRLVRSTRSRRRSPGLLTTFRVLSTTAVLLMLLHVAEVGVWAIAYRQIPDLTELHTFEVAAYFSIVTFTSLGYGDVVISNSWRLLSGIQAIVGLLVFSWSAALLFAVVQRLWMEGIVQADMASEVPGKTPSPLQRNE